MIKATINISETINMLPIELLNKQHSNVIIPAEIIAPIVMERKAKCMFIFVSPAIKLALHTPVKGNGTAVKHVSARYLLNRLFDCSILLDFAIYLERCLLIKNPDVLFFKYLVIKIIA